MLALELEVPCIRMQIEIETFAKKKTGSNLLKLRQREYPEVDLEESFAEMKSLQMLREELWPSNLSLCNSLLLCCAAVRWLVGITLQRHYRYYCSMIFSTLVVMQFIAVKMAGLSSIAELSNKARILCKWK